MTPDQRRKVVRNPLLIWGALMLLVLATLGYAYLPHGPFKAETGLAIAAAKAGLIAWVFMQLRAAAGIVRMAALAGLTWATFLYLFAFADFLTR